MVPLTEAEEAERRMKWVVDGMIRCIREAHPHLPLATNKEAWQEFREAAQVQLAGKDLLAKGNIQEAIRMLTDGQELGKPLQHIPHPVVGDKDTPISVTGTQLSTALGVHEGDDFGGSVAMRGHFSRDVAPKMQRAEEMVEAVVKEMQAMYPDSLLRQDKAWDEFRQHAVHSLVTKGGRLETAQDLHNGLKALADEHEGNLPHLGLRGGQEKFTAALANVLGERGLKILKQPPSDGVRDDLGTWGNLQTHLGTSQRGAEQRLKERAVSEKEQMLATEAMAVHAGLESARQAKDMACKGFNHQLLHDNLKGLFDKGMIESVEVRDKKGEMLPDFLKQESVDGDSIRDYIVRFKGDAEDGSQRTMHIHAAPGQPAKIKLSDYSDASIKQAAAALAGTFDEIAVNLPDGPEQAGELGSTPRARMLVELEKQKEQGKKITIKEPGNPKLTEVEKTYIKSHKEQRKTAEVGDAPSV